MSRRWEWPDPGDATRVRGCKGKPWPVMVWSRRPGEVEWYPEDTEAADGLVHEWLNFIELLAEYGPLEEVPDG